MEPDELYRLDNHGRLKWKTHKILISSALRYECQAPRKLTPSRH
jgi:hypothetical protein